MFMRIQVNGRQLEYISNYIFISSDLANKQTSNTSPSHPFIGINKHENELPSEQLHLIPNI